MLGGIVHKVEICLTRSAVCNRNRRFLGRTVIMLCHVIFVQLFADKIQAPILAVEIKDNGTAVLNVEPEHIVRHRRNHSVAHTGILVVLTGVSEHERFIAIKLGLFEEPIIKRIGAIGRAEEQCKGFFGERARKSAENADSAIFPEAVVVFGKESNACFALPAVIVVRAFIGEDRACAGSGFINSGLIVKEVFRLGYDRNCLETIVFVDDKGKVGYVAFELAARYCNTAYNRSRGHGYGRGVAGRIGVRLGAVEGIEYIALAF